jgi:type II secretory pathway pseudopilin PulG
MRKARAFTIIELTLATALTAIIVGALGTVYVFAARESSESTAAASATRQAQMLMAEISDVVSQAVNVQIYSAGGNTGLKCTMPVNGLDTDGDGYLDTYTPRAIGKRGYEKYGYGKRIWFYRSGATGAFASLGGIVWRAQRNDDNAPTAFDKDTAWTYYPGVASTRWNLIERMTFALDAPNKTVTVNITGSSLMRADRVGNVAEVAEGQAAKTAISQNIFWRNWRK